MLDWLTGTCSLFGFAGQNWMLVVGGGLLAYIAVLAFSQWRHPRTDSSRFPPD